MSVRPRPSRARVRGRAGPGPARVVGAALGAVLLAGCATTAPTAAADGRITVVAAENFWGSIAAQLGGEHAAVTSVIANPNTDPHDYEATAADGREVALAGLVLDNGVGYDPWMSQLVAADPDPHRIELTVGPLVGVGAGGNPHRWYSPTDVHRVIAAITADYQRLDPADAGYFAARRDAFEHTGLHAYDQLVASIRTTYAGTPIGASESIVAPLAQGLGLDLTTPASFLDAISEGSDPTAADKSLVDAQIRRRQIKVYVYNSQNSTPDVRAEVSEARAAGIPVATVTETLDPAGDTFQDWQVRQLRGLATALHEATGR
jgi:zinc/manganese transport system substrate-binding protein